MNLRDIVIYVAGPYRADCPWQVEQNIREAEKYALALWEAGFTAICPHKNTSRFTGYHGLPESVWLDGCLVLCRRSDAILLLPRWLDSDGTKEEKADAEATGIPVFYATEGFVETIKRHFLEITNRDKTEIEGEVKVGPEKDKQQCAECNGAGRILAVPGQEQRCETCHGLGRIEEA